jgi:hypothetical protein
MDACTSPAGPQNCSVCNHFAVLYGLAGSRSRLYVSGAFARIDGVTRDGLAALDPRTGALIRRWQPARAGHGILHLSLSNDCLAVSEVCPNAVSIAWCRLVTTAARLVQTSRRSRRLYRSSSP